MRLTLLNCGGGFESPLSHQKFFKEILKNPLTTTTTCGIMSSESEGSKKPPLNKGLRPTARKEVYTMRSNITYVSVLCKVIENSTDLSS